MSEPFRDALAAAVGLYLRVPKDLGGYTDAAGRIMAALPPEWRDFVAAREPLLALVANVEAIRALHDKDPNGGMGWMEEGGYGSIDSACRICGTPDEYAVPWPCETRTRADDILADPAIVKFREVGRG